MDNQRQRIEQLDSLIVDLLDERVKVGQEIARIKRRRGLDIEDSGQEQVVIERAQNQTELDVEGVFREVIEMTKTEMRNDS